MRVEITLLNDTHIGGEPKGSLLDFLKTRKGEPYIPATHVKGVMRSEAERLLRATQEIPCAITGMAGGEAHGIRVCEELRERGEFRCEICRLFGAPNMEGGRAYSEGKLRFFDFHQITTGSFSGMRTHVMIDRSTGRAREKGLYSVLTIPKGTTFTGEILIREPLTESEKKILEGCLQAMSHYGLGKERSRGLGRIEVSYDKQEIGVTVND